MNGEPLSKTIAEFADEEEQVTRPHPAKRNTLDESML
jgi:hypothetical protein